MYMTISRSCLARQHQCDEGFYYIRDMDSFAKRLLWARTQKDLSQEDLGKLIGVSQSTIGNYEAGLRNNPRKITKLAECLGVSAKWLEEGVGSPYREQAASAKVLDSNVEPGPDMRARVPLISFVQAGSWCEATDPYNVGDAEDWLACPVKHGPRTYALRVRGQSMHNPGGEISFAEGDIIFVDPDRDAIHKSLVVMRLDDSNEATFKRLLTDGEKRFLEALNPSWPNRIFEINGDARPCGVVIAKLESFI
jgi:SOS-response transcriptional repressor LexA